LLLAEKRGGGTKSASKISLFKRAKRNKNKSEEGGGGQGGGSEWIRLRQGGCKKKKGAGGRSTLVPGKKRMLFELKAGETEGKADAE